MALTLVELGMLAALDKLSAASESDRWIGLYQDPFTLTRQSTIASIVPADFSGYSGVKPLVFWSAAVIVGERAETTTPLVTWTHNGGNTGNWIQGYYVVNAAGELMWAEERVNGPLLVVSSGQKVEIRPRFSLGSRFP